MVLSIVILNYKKKHFTIRCLTSLIRMLRKELEHDVIEIIIVDNKSPDDSHIIIKNEINKNNLKNISLLSAYANVGFGKGCNFGARHAKGKYLLFLNNDTVVKDKGIMKMVAYIQRHPEIAILGGRLFNHDGTQQPSVGKFYTPLNVSLLMLGLQNIDQTPVQVTEVDWVKGALFMIRKHAFQKLGGFDSNIFMYTEDMELCYRAKKEGYKIFFYPFVDIVHAEQGSSSRSFAIVNIYKNLLYFYKKHRSPAEYLYVKILIKSKALLLYLSGKVLNNNYLTHTYEKALKVS